MRGRARLFSALRGANASALTDGRYIALTESSFARCRSARSTVIR